MALSNFVTLSPNLDDRTDDNMAVLESLKVKYPGGANALRRDFEELSRPNYDGLYCVRLPHTVTTDRLIDTVRNRFASKIMGRHIAGDFPDSPEACIALYSSSRYDPLLHYCDVGLEVGRATKLEQKAKGTDDEKLIKRASAIAAEAAQKAALREDLRLFREVHPGYEILICDIRDFLYWVLLNDVGAGGYPFGFPLDRGAMGISSSNADLAYVKSWNNQVFATLCSYTEAPVMGFGVKVVKS